MIKVGLIGIGGMGRTHFQCYRNNPGAEIVALCDIEEAKLKGDWGSVGLNIGTIEYSAADLSNVKTTTDYRELIANPEVDLVDICLPTDLHAEVAIEALHAGKHVMCEKPMGLDSGQCWAIDQVFHQSGRQLMIGHCLRYWPQYVEADRLIRSGEFGKVLYASFHRSGATPSWSSRDWLRRPERSGGAVLDMHIHDVDTALWWFGKPSSIHASGVAIHGLPNIVDAQWRYEDGPVVNLHGSWDNNGGPFRYGFKVVMERATLSCDSGVNNAQLTLIQSGDESPIHAEAVSAYQAEIDDFLRCLANGERMERVTPEDARLAVEMVREELRQMGAHT